MRFRVNPELHISDNLRIMSQIDMLDNLVLGSTPEGYYNTPSPAGGYVAQSRGGYTPLGIFTATQWSPVAGVNSTTNSIAVKRVWGEYMTPVGLLRFGRMPNQWGLGMVANSGDGYDSDWQSTADRIMFITGIKKYDLYFSGMWDFAASGATSQTFAQQQGQPTRPRPARRGEPVGSARRAQARPGAAAPGPRQGQPRVQRRRLLHLPEPVPRQRLGAAPTPRAGGQPQAGPGRTSPRRG